MVKNKQENKFQILPNEVYHREDDPAIVYLDGEKEWWKNGKLNRGNGPAVELNNGGQIVNYTEKMAQPNGNSHFSSALPIYTKFSKHMKKPKWQTEFRDLPKIPNTKKWLKGEHETIEQKISKNLQSECQLAMPKGK